ncbi:hypothetical protein HanXRQr2_Chr05g0208801 [Helianthus annuus]|uniref:Uncharacterized protein n=1 Tax=Helianthus annuus TaxID=4232 RepID=A0A9K3IZ38_HELAN|nr:hypothetical protein HanXRQr2_Chr05g0208801 [Helianthus annuus]KAJ0569838.1 hypothetical protein HanHA300_Chr05g0171121 [Helianthus annuus]KAJ0584160.1 hypothetical protein HanHA89_Chr05g0185311 [Helianthus annuus]KAJ0749829.1 hypothetical protein HanLR1_Chr05g0174701 [Helianthus annuus]
MSPAGVPPDIPPDLSSEVRVNGVEGSAGFPPDIPPDLSLGNAIEVPMVVSKEWLGDNWVARMFNEKLEIGDSKLVASFRSESDLREFGVNFAVILCVEGLGLQGCDFKVLANLFGSVQEILAGIVQLCSCRAGSVVKFPQLEVNANAFELNSNASLVFMDKRKKRSVRNEGTQVKACKVNWGGDNVSKVPVLGDGEFCKEVLPDGAAASEMVDELGKERVTGGEKEVVKRSKKCSDLVMQGQQFTFATSVLKLEFNPGSRDGSVKEVVPLFSENKVNKIGDDVSGMGKANKSKSSVSMKKLIQEKSAELKPYCITKKDLPLLNSLKPSAKSGW